jgi:hypothetical protein
LDPSQKDRPHRRNQPQLARPKRRLGQTHLATNGLPDITTKVILSEALSAACRHERSAPWQNVAPFADCHPERSAAENPSSGESSFPARVEGPPEAAGTSPAAGPGARGIVAKRRQNLKRGPRNCRYSSVDRLLDQARLQSCRKEPARSNALT